MANRVVSEKAVRSEKTLCQAAKSIRENNPGRVPIICELDQSRSVKGWATKRAKFLVSDKLNVTKFRRFIRGNLVCSDKDCAETKAPRVLLYLANGRELCEEHLGVSELDQLHGHSDGFLYLKYVTTFQPKVSHQTSVLKRPTEAAAAEEEDNRISDSSEKADIDEKIEPKLSESKAEQNSDDGILASKTKETTDSFHSSCEKEVAASNDAEAADEGVLQPKVDRKNQEAPSSLKEQLSLREETQMEKSINEEETLAKEKDDTLSPTNEDSVVSNSKLNEENEKIIQNEKISQNEKTSQNEKISQSEMTSQNEKISQNEMTSQNEKISQIERDDLSSPHNEDGIKKIAPSVISENPEANVAHSEEEQSSISQCELTATTPNEGTVQPSPALSATSSTTASPRISPMEHPATKEDDDILYKSPRFAAQTYTLSPPKMALDHTESETPYEFEAGPHSEGRSLWQHSHKNQFEPTATNGFDSMILSDDSFNREDSASSIGGVEGWPTLSRDSTAEESTSSWSARTPLILGQMNNLNREQRILNQQQHDIFRQHRQSSLLPKNGGQVRFEDEDEDDDDFGEGMKGLRASIYNEDSEWVELDEFDAAASPFPSSLELGKAYLFDKLSQFEIPQVNKRVLSSKAESLRNLVTTTIMRGHEAERGHAVGVVRNSQFFDASDDSDEWTCVEVEADPNSLV